MKPLMIRGSLDEDLPNKLVYGRTYLMAVAGVSHEGFTFKLKKRSKVVVLKDDLGEYLESKKWLKRTIKSGMLQFLVEIESEEKKLFKDKGEECEWIKRNMAFTRHTVVPCMVVNTEMMIVL